MTPQDHEVEELLNGATLPTGTEVASYATHMEAQTAIDYLSEHDFDIRTVSIVGMDVHLVEHITGRLTPTRVAFGGATSGLLWGGFFGLMMSFVNTSLPGNAWIAVGLGGGALVGMLLAVVSYMMRGGKRDFVSHTHVIAQRYAILAQVDVQRAFDLLQKTPGNQRRPARPRPRRVESDGPTEYGSRPDEKPRFGVRVTEMSVEEYLQRSPEASASQDPAENGETAGRGDSTGRGMNAQTPEPAERKEPPVSQEPTASLEPAASSNPSGDDAPENPYAPPKE